MKTRTILIAIGITLALAALLGGGFLVGSQLWGGGWCQSGPGMTGFHGTRLGMHTSGGGILMFLFLAVIVGGVALLAVSLARRGPQSADRRESPLEILKRRYASGEIDGDEFERMKELLSR